MNDLEICKRIAEIEGAVKTEIFTSNKAGEKTLAVYFSLSGDYGQPMAHHNYNPLTDDGLCFRLMKKYSICLDINPTDNGDPIAWSNVMAISASNKSPNKAICLAIIEANT